MGLVSSILRFGINQKLFDSLEGVSEENKELLKGIDNYTLILVSSSPKKVLTAEPVLDDAIVTEEIDAGWKRCGDKGYNDWKKPLFPVDRRNLKVTKDLNIDMLEEDDVFGEVNASLFKLLRKDLAFPLLDKIVKVDDATALSVARDLKVSPRDEGQASPVPYHTWDEMTSDEAMTRIFFYGIGSLLVAIQPEGAADKYKEEGLGPFVVDMPIADLPVRSQFRPYGFRAHFDADQKITGIYDYHKKKLIKPDEGQDWERAKHLAKVTTLSVITVREHLLWTHFLSANYMIVAMTDFLAPNHPMRRLLTVFSFRTNFVNLAASETLLPELSMVHRMTGFTFKGIQTVFSEGYKASNIFEPFAKRSVAPEIKQLSAEGKFPYIPEGTAWYNICHEFVEEWFSYAPEVVDSDNVAADWSKKFYDLMVKVSKGQAYEIPPDFTKDNLVDLCTQLIFNVTGYHEIVGTVVDYTEKPSHGGFRVLKDESSTQTDLQSYLLAASLTATTAVRMPSLTGKFANFFGAGGAPEWERTVWDNFQAKLKAQSKIVQAADAKRDYEFKTMDPGRFECAVSV